MAHNTDSVKWCRIAVVGTTPAIRRFYRRLRSQGFSQRDAEYMTYGAVMFSGEGTVSRHRVPDGVEMDAHGRAEGMKPVSALVRPGTAGNQPYVKPTDAELALSILRSILRECRKDDMGVAYVVESHLTIDVRWVPVTAEEADFMSRLTAEADQ